MRTEHSPLLNEHVRAHSIHPSRKQDDRRCGQGRKERKRNREGPLFSAVRRHRSAINDQSPALINPKTNTHTHTRATRHAINTRMGGISPSQKKRKKTHSKRQEKNLNGDREEGGREIKIVKRNTLSTGSGLAGPILNTFSDEIRFLSKRTVSFSLEAFLSCPLRRQTETRRLDRPFISG